jgi:hypothetical protein
MVKLLHPEKPYIFNIQFRQTEKSFFSWYGLLRYIVFSLLSLSFHLVLGSAFAQAQESYLKLEYQLDISGVKPYQLDDLFRPFIDAQGGFHDILFEESKSYFSAVVYGNAGKEMCEQLFQRYGAEANLIAEKEIEKTAIKNTKQLTFANQQEKGARREERFDKIIKEDGKEYHVFDKAWYESLPDVKKDRIQSSGVLFILKD